MLPLVLKSVDKIEIFIVFSMSYLEFINRNNKGATKIWIPFTPNIFVESRFMIY